MLWKTVLLVYKMDIGASMAGQTEFDTSRIRVASERQRIALQTQVVAFFQNT